MVVIAWIFVNVAWLIPGPPHRWARRLKAERAAARKYKLRR
jgi:hypothetical protein